uniref:CcoQ/FixQ family Cbb3-type cytochrome c oxidase assembly chaperone n=1 Tax=Roseihalotalea indica TaxID=2867963 RepID=A0AA49GQM7_9BACT|nr:CcoQ/FixQ family Cbb3-type cytochrome c oxidase assembly chaperone [Tunicatimonas sp. TK19036]
MLKFIKYHMETITGIEIYPIISFLIFFIFFLALLYFVFSASKEHMASMSALPLEESEHPSENQLPS